MEIGIAFFGSGSVVFMRRMNVLITVGLFFGASEKANRFDLRF